MRLVAKYDPETGDVARWRPVTARDHNPDLPGAEFDVGQPGRVESVTVDPEAGEVTNVSLRSLDEVTRSEISQPTVDGFEQARSAGDLQAQIDVLWEIVTGKEPGGGTN